jgi:Flp pilus assembly pilin Flp
VATVMKINRARLVEVWLDDSGQSMTEYILIIGLITLPVYVLFKTVFQRFINRFVAALIGSFTRG